MRTAALLGLCATAAVAVLGFTSLGGTTARASRPVLHVVRSSTLTVRGEHFRSHELIRVSAAAKVGRAKADDEGYFVITIRGADRCSATRVLARGSAGSYALVKLLASPACLPARSR